MEEFRIVMTLIEQGNNYVLQRRDINPNIGAAGLVGCFGGRIEDGETAIEAAVREIREETNLAPNSDELSYVGEVDVISDYQRVPIKVNSQVFRFSARPEIEIAAEDGECVIYAKDEATSHLPEMTPATRATFARFILKEGN
jgi:8-oxo-dGTP pyrophosphatase MutT (NUDIX family)